MGSIYRLLIWLPALLWAAPAIGQILLEPLPEVHYTISPNIVFLTSGPENLEEAVHLRVSISTEEIYDAIYIERIGRVMEYEGMPVVLDTYALSGFEMAEQLGLEAGALHRLEFVTWLAWNQVLMKEQELFFIITMTDRYEFELTPLKEKYGALGVRTDIILQDIVFGLKDNLVSAMLP